MLTVENSTQAFAQVARRRPEYPGGFKGRGIVIPAGGVRYFTNAWVCVNILRRLGCQLPIELWHLGPDEMRPDMRTLLEPLGVRTVDALSVRQSHPARTLKGWELKPYAVIHSTFEEVLLLDADNVPVLDPTFLFSERPYRDMGAIFWPDFENLGPERAVWRLTGVKYRDQPEFETGQVVLNKRTCWRPLLLAMWMNEHSDFWYQHVHGDKETFHFAWLRLGFTWAMPRRRIFALPGTMCQHDFQDHRLFQHRNTAKWSLTENARVPGFELEEECFELLNELRHVWHPRESILPKLDEPDHAQMAALTGRRFSYLRVAHAARPISLAEGGIISEGAAQTEALWWIERGEMFIAADDGSITCRLRCVVADLWFGTTEDAERAPVQLEPLTSPASPTPSPVQ